MIQSYESGSLEPQEKKYKDTYIFPDDSPLKKVRQEPEQRPIIQENPTPVKITDQKPKVLAEPEIEEIKIAEKSKPKKHQIHDIDMKAHKTGSPNKKSHKKDKKESNLVYYVLGVLALLIIAAIFFFANQPKGVQLPQMWDGNVIAQVNGQDVTIEDFNTQLSKVPPSYRLYVTKDLILNQTIIEEVLLQEADKEGIEISESDIDAQVSKWENNLNKAVSKEQLDDILLKSNLTYGEFKRRSADLIATQMKIAVLFNESVINRIKITDKAAKAYFDANRSLFNVPETRKISHILVLKSPQGNRTDEEAKAVIDEVKGKLDSGADFFDLVAEYSEDPGSKDKDGIYNITRNMTVKPFEDVAFSLDVGEVSEPFPTQFGYHIMKLLDVTPASNKEFGDVKGDIKNKLSYDQQKILVPQYISDLLAKAKIKLFAFNTGVPAMDIRTFEQVNPSICTDELGRPIVRMYSVSYQDASMFGQDALTQAIAGFKDSDKLSFHSWQIDTKDDVLTSGKESDIPQAELDLFKKFNPGNSVPAYLIGCKYFRIGNGYWDSKDKASEVLELEAIFDEVLFENAHADAMAAEAKTNPLRIDPKAAK